MPKKKEGVQSAIISPSSYLARKIACNEPSKEGIQAKVSKNLLRLAPLYSLRPKIIGNVSQFPVC
jgi:hypothetical protein